MLHLNSLFGHQLDAGILLCVASALLTGCAADPRPEAEIPIEESVATDPGPQSEPEAVLVSEPLPEPHPEPRPEVEPERWAELKAEIRDKFPDVAQLSVQELGDWMLADAEPPVLLDVRELEEFEVSHLESAQRARNEQAALAALDGLPKDRRVVLYCSVGYRSSQLATKLIERGFTKVYNLEGSIFEWANEDGAVYAKGGEVSVVHPYDSDWGQLLRRDRWSSMEGED